VFLEQTPQVDSWAGATGWQSRSRDHRILGYGRRASEGRNEASALLAQVAWDWSIAFSQKCGHVVAKGSRVMGERPLKKECAKVRMGQDENLAKLLSSIIVIIVNNTSPK
jgi:hypothetical protein